MYIVTEAFDVPKDLPVLRDLNGLLYAREWSGGLLVGGFELEAKPCFVENKAGVL
jgi:pyruvate dehydrogenase phosphatase regulatory subunit